MVNMGQASMRYKLGKLLRVPMDDTSFAFHQQYIVNEIFKTWSRDAKLSLDPNTSDDDKKNSDYIMSHYRKGERRGISSSKFMSPKQYTTVDKDNDQTNKNYINYLFNVVLGRDAKATEMAALIDHINLNGFKSYLANVDSENKDRQEYVRFVGRYYLQNIVFEYISRLDEVYFFKEIK